MSELVDNRTWLLDAGGAAIQKKCMHGKEALTLIERLTYCLWVADYSMTNAGDLVTAADLYPPFKGEAAEMAGQLSLQLTYQAFSLPTEVLQEEYDHRFDFFCAEVRAFRG